MKISFEVNSNNAFNRIFSNDVLYYANSRLYAYCDPYVPFRTGMLSQDVTITKDAVTYNRDYAQKVHDNGSLNFTKDFHPLATANWEKSMAAAKGQQLADDITDYIKRR